MECLQRLRPSMNRTRAWTVNEDLAVTVPLRGQEEKEGETNDS